MKGKYKQKKQNQDAPKNREEVVIISFYNHLSFVILNQYPNPKQIIGYQRSIQVN